MDAINKNKVVGSSYVEPHENDPTLPFDGLSHGHQLVIYLEDSGKLTIDVPSKGVAYVLM